MIGSPGWRGRPSGFVGEYTQFKLILEQRLQGDPREHLILRRPEGYVMFNNGSESSQVQHPTYGKGHRHGAALDEVFVTYPFKCGTLMVLTSDYIK